MNITITADVVAWYAAIVATGSGLIGAYAVWRDRTRLKVSARAGLRIIGSDEFPNDGKYIVVRVANSGRRPVTLKQAPTFVVKGSNGEDGRYAVTGPWRPKADLAEGESAEMISSQDNLLKTAQADIRSVLSVHVEDAVGRVWKARIQGTEQDDS